jgi:Na+/H+ antiporter NhaD/arsenite permease-like protein
LGVYIAPQFDLAIKTADVVAGFPTDLFLTLVGTTLLFAVAEVNGTLRLLVDRATACAGGRAALVPAIFFVLTAIVSAVGAGSIAASALVAPSAMSVAARLGISPMLMALVVAHGSVAGGLTPITPIGVITVDKLNGLGLGDIVWKTAAYNAAAGTLAAACGYLLFVRRRMPIASADVPTPPTDAADALRADRRHLLTAVAIAVVFTAVILGGVHLGLSAITAAGALLMLRAADEKTVFRLVPWSVVLMVCGVSMLVKLCETAGALDLLAEILGHAATPRTVNAWMALVAGGVSIFSSTSGVVLPTFLPMVPDVAAHVGVGDVAGLATSVVLGANLVDVSPLSTIGALCVAAAPPSIDNRRLFNQLLIWGALMAPAAAAIAFLLLR